MKKRSEKASTPSRSTTSSTTDRQRKSAVKKRATKKKTATKKTAQKKKATKSKTEPSQRLDPETTIEHSSSHPLTSDELIETEPVPLVVTGPVEQLTSTQQSAYIDLLAKGASSAGACARLGLSVTAVVTTMDADAAFRSQLSQIDLILSHNVAAALYRAAMEGKVTAQTFLLKNRPPSGWDKTETTPTLDDLESLTDDELDTLLRDAIKDLAEVDPA